MNIGVFLPNWVGDVVMATPALRALRTKFRQARLIGILRPHLGEVLAGTPWLDEQVLYDPRSQAAAHRAWQVIRRLRTLRLDTAVLLTNSLRTALVAWLGGASERIGYVRGGRGWLLNRKLMPRRQHGRFVPAPVLDYYLDLAYALGCPPEPPRLELATSRHDERAADQAWRRLGLAPQERVVAFNSSGAFGAAKLWPSEHFADLARRIVADHDASVLVLCGPAERQRARQIAAAAAHPRVVSLADEPLSIGLSKACVRRSSLLVTTDSGPRHFAAAFNVPVITLFGPTHIAWSENHFARATHLQLQLPCTPCQQRTCPLQHHRCMRELSVVEVYRAVAEVLEASPAAQAA